MKKEREITPRSLGTHDGSFHADEVTACALLLLFDLIDKDKIKRTREPRGLSLCEYVCDVGGIYDPCKKRFDHHQLEYKGPLSSAGMVLLYLKEEGYIDKEFYEYFNNTIILGVDAHDNGIDLKEKGVWTFSLIIANFLPANHEATIKEHQECFFKALDFALEQLCRIKEHYEYIRSCREKVQKCMSNSKDVLIFEEALPWMENFFQLNGEAHSALFVIMPTGVHWKLRGIPPSMEESMKVRLPLPQEWAGLHDDALKKVSGIEGALFCHKGRFISIWQTKEDALKAWELVLEEHRKKNK